MAYITLTQGEFQTLLNSIRSRCTNLSLGINGHLLWNGAIVTPGQSRHLPCNLHTKLIEMGKAGDIRQLS
ncbi:hypothetical protein [Coralliovum pocilloporae]|uniref:hypothetical protein n=1 Tax=Coralliovum pocilloporae TaxID=3066369 RepID=UPI003307748C